ncbi:ankyrin repeat domain-containing protein [Klebsiella pneumoniae]|uniref:ankyrin repeat domain-containing protein n=1 Tax=Klebsiella pneumoniae TaxID=573 RepID=UPI003A5CEB0B
MLDINKQDKAGKTVLFYAVLMGNTEAVKFFISAGGDVSIKDNQGRKAADQITLLDLQNASSMSEYYYQQRNNMNEFSLDTLKSYIDRNQTSLFYDYLTKHQLDTNMNIYLGVFCLFFRSQKMKTINTIICSV